MTFKQAEALLYAWEEFWNLADLLLGPSSKSYVAVRLRGLLRSDPTARQAAEWEALLEVLRVLARVRREATEKEKLLLDLRYGAARLTWEQIDRLKLPGLSGSTARRVREALVEKVRGAFEGREGVLRKAWRCAEE